MNDPLRRWPRLRHPLPWIMLLVGVLVGVLPGGIAHLVPDAKVAVGAPLVIATGVDESRGNARQALLDLWNADHPDKQARFEYVRGAADDQHSQMVRYAKGEERVAVDAFNLDVTAVPEFADQGYITEWTAAQQPKQLLDGLLAQPRQSCHYAGKLWGLPFNTDAGVLFYRRQLMGDTPQHPRKQITWTDIRMKSARISAASAPLVAGFACQLSDDYEGLTVNLLEALWAIEQERQQPATAQPLGVSTDPAVWRAAVDRLFGLAAGDTRVVLPASRRFKENDTSAEFLSGAVGTMRNWPVAYRKLLDDSDQAGKVTSADIGVTVLPGPAVLGGQNLAVSATSTRGDDVRQLITFLAGTPAQRILMQVGGFAANTASVYDLPEIKAAYPHAATVLAAVRHSRQRLQTAHYPLFSEAIRGLAVEIRDTGVVPADLARRLSDAAAGRLTPPKRPAS